MSRFPISTKGRAPIFTFDVVCDNKGEMLSSSHPFDPNHPLLAGRERLDRILDVMYAKIHKTLFRRNPGQRPRPETGLSTDAGGSERILYGTGVSADDVLAEALIALLQYPPERLRGTWEGLAVGIAGKKAVDALRASGKGLRGTDHRTELRLMSGDADGVSRDGDRQPSIFEGLPASRGNPDDEYLALEAALEFLKLTRELLDERDREIFFAIHFEGYSRKEMAERLGLTGQRIGQIYNDAARRLEAHPDYPFKQAEGVIRLIERRT